MVLEPSAVNEARFLTGCTAVVLVTYARLPREKRYQLEKCKSCKKVTSWEEDESQKDVGSIPRTSDFLSL